MSEARSLNASTMIWFTSRISGASDSTSPPSDAPIEVRTRISAHSNGCGIAGMNLCDLVLKHRRLNPLFRQIDDREQARVQLHVHVRQRVAFDDVAAHGRIDLDGAAHSALTFQPCDLARRHSPEA